MDVQKILDDIAIEGQKLGGNDDNAQRALLARARDLVAALDSPIENIYGYMLAEVRVTTQKRLHRILTSGMKAKSNAGSSDGIRSATLRDSGR